MTGGPEEEPCGVPRSFASAGRAKEKRHIGAGCYRYGRRAGVSLARPSLPQVAQSGSAPVFGLEASFVMTSSMLDVH